MAQLRSAHLNPPGRGADQRLREALRAGAAGDPEAARAGDRACKKAAIRRGVAVAVAQELVGA